MRRAVRIALVLTWGAVAAAVGLAPEPQLFAQAGGPGAALPSDVDPVSRNRLPQLKPGVTGAAAIRLHRSGADARWASPLGRALTELAILTTAREHDQPYEWSLHEMEALAVGLEPSTIDVVRRGRPLRGLSEREAVIVQIGREIFRTHHLTPATYARATKALGVPNVVDIVDLMAIYTSAGARLTAFNQQMPPGWKQFLPLPFTLPADIHEDSRSRLPLIRTKTVNPQANLWARLMTPEGTGPNHIARHAGSPALLEASVGRATMALARLVSAREHHSQYGWTMREPEAGADGLAPQTIDVVRHGRPTAGLPEKDAALVQFGRELFGRHYVTAETYAAALRLFGERDLVDLVGLMGQEAGDAVLFAGFDQYLPADRAPLLPTTDARSGRAARSAGSVR